MSEYIENVNEICDESLNEVAGGKNFPYGPGGEIQWNDQRCVECAAWCRDFKAHFKDSSLYSPTEKERVYYLCDQFCMYINTKEGFDLGMAQSTFCQLSCMANLHTMDRQATHKWQILSMVFSSVVDFV